MIDHEVVHLAINPPANLDANLLGSVAAVINKNLSDTRLLLAGKIPRIIAHYQSAQMAESIAQNLRDLGLMALVCRDFEPRPSSSSFMVKTMEFREEEVVFRDGTGHEKTIGQNKVFLILEGRVQTSMEVETTNPTFKFSLTKTFLTGGIPVWSKVNKKSIAQSIKDEHFVRLYDRVSPDPIIEMFQHHVDYSFLGIKKLDAYSLTNFQAVVLKFRELFTQAIFDDRLVKPFMVNPYSTQPWKDVEIHCCLIYQFHIKDWLTMPL